MSDTQKEQELERLKSEVKGQGNVPAHVAVIMDGNGRWAQRHNLPISDGHAAGVRAAKSTVKIARETGVGVLTLYTFSVQNWRRSKSEVRALMELLSQSALKEVDELAQEGVRVVVSGNLRGIPMAQRKAIEMVIKRTAGGDKLILNLALNYGGREEIVKAVRDIVTEVGEGKLEPNEINEEIFKAHLYTSGLPDPDLLIRTSGEMRISNFLLWQSAYTEFYVTDILWPDFDEVEFCRALIEYAQRQRRFGAR